MVQVGDTIVSFDLFEKRFFCDIKKCRGECCVEGDSGAPLLEEEIAKIEEVLPIIWETLSEKAKKIIERDGVSMRDVEGDLVTTIVDGRECVFSFFDEDGVCKCAIEKAYREGLTKFYKPISCHLYPVRLQDFGLHTAVNLHKWKVCKVAFDLGMEKGVRAYKFLKEPLIRRFGEDWYAELELVAEELLKSGYIK